MEDYIDKQTALALVLREKMAYARMVNTANDYSLSEEHKQLWRDAKIAWQDALHELQSAWNDNQGLFNGLY